MKTVEQLYEELRAAVDNGHESMTHEDALTCVRSMHEATATTHRAAQAGEPAYKDSTPELHIGESAFESWYSTYSPTHKSDKQRAREAYAAGMGDPLVTAAPATVEGPSDDETQELPGIVDKALNELAGFVKFLETANNSWGSRTAKNALRDIEWFARRKLAAAPTTQPAHRQDDLDAITLLAECRDAFPTPEHGSPIENEWMAACSDPSEVPGYMRAVAGLMAQPSPAVQGDALDAPVDADVQQDAERYRYLRDGVLVDGEVNEDLYVHVDHQSYPNRWALVGLELDEAIDAARAAQEGK